jgi:hypothetical protein
MPATATRTNNADNVGQAREILTMIRKKRKFASKSSNAKKAKEVLSTVREKRTPPAPKGVAAKVMLTLPENLRINFVNFTKTNNLADLFGGIMEQEKKVLIAFAFDDFVAKLWASKQADGKSVRPVNPKIHVADDGMDSFANYVIQSSWSISFPQPESNEKTSEELAIDALTKGLVEAGMDAEEAEAASTQFVNNELDLSPKPGIDLDKWLRSESAEDKDMASRAIRILNAQNAKEFAKVKPLTEEELNRLIEDEFKPTVNPGFFERVTTYVETIEQLKVIFKFVKPKCMFGDVEFAKDALPQERNKRLVKAAKAVIGPTE